MAVQPRISASHVPSSLAGRIESARTVARESVTRPGVEEPLRRVNRRLIRSLGDSGLLSSLFPVRYGGTSQRPLSATDICVLREAIAQELPIASTALALQAGGIYLVLEQAQEHVAQRWVPSVVRGDAVAAVALTEPKAGSDLAAMELRAIPNDTGWTLVGEKSWIMNAPDADIYTVFAKTNPDAGRRGISAFLVPGDSPGLSGSPIDSIWPGPVGRLIFDGVQVPHDHLLGSLNDGFRAGLTIFNKFRPAVAAHAVGIAASALDLALSYATTRRAFGAQIGSFQAVAHPIADMSTQLTAARLLVYESARLCDLGEGAQGGTLSSMAKLYATEVAQTIVDQSLQIHGASGLEDSHPMMLLYTEIRAARIYEGTSEILRNSIANTILRDHGLTAG